eukprot:336540_1
MAGANISGNLKNPSRSIPIGTTAAIFISTVVYIAISWILGATVEREVLLDDSMVMNKISVFIPLMIVGIFASTLSSGMSCFVGAPRIFQAVCKDNLFPALQYFAQARESDGEPIRCYFIAFVICFLSILSGNINLIAPIITNFFLVTYALMNYSCFVWSLSKSPGWRPSFSFFNEWISLFACVECIALMFWIDWLMALITLILGVFMYKYIEYVDPKVNWGTASEAMIYKKTCSNLLKYQQTSHAKIQKPIFFLFNTSTKDIVDCFNVANMLNYSEGLILIGNVMVGKYTDNINKFIKIRQNKDKSEIPQNIMKRTLIEAVIANTFADGCRTLIQTAGMSGIRPNVIIIKHTQRNCPRHSHSNAASITPIQPIQPIVPSDECSVNMDECSSMNMDVNEEEAPLWFKNLHSALSAQCGVIMLKDDDIMNHLQHKDNKNNIDIWWLYDDGGLTVLIAYLLQKNVLYKDCNLRIMALDAMGIQDQTELAHLMTRFRINATVVSVCDEKEIDAAIENDQKVNIRGIEYSVSEFGFKKIRQYKAIGKLIKKHSKQSKLCIITMPFPRKQYLWWEYHNIIQCLSPSQDVPVMFVRG